VWTNSDTRRRGIPNRSIASDSDCLSIAHELVSPTARAERLKLKTAESIESEELFKLKNSIWNKIITSKDFENFNDQEYFRWMELYKDESSDLWQINPVSVEQKIALIEVINSRLIPLSLSEERKLTSEIEKLSAYKLRILQSHMKHFDLSSKITRSDLNSFASDLMIILKGPPVSLLDYFTSNKTERMNERMMRTLQEDMLLMGLRGLVDRVPEKVSYTKLEKSKYMVQNFFQLKIWKYLVLPYDLPWIERVKIPDELLQKIMIDGLRAHEQELISHLKNQGMIDHYERFRKVYKPLAFSLGFYFYYEKFKTSLSGEITENQEKEKTRLVNDFKKLAENILKYSEAPEKNEDVLKNEQYNRLIETYKIKFKTDPTPEEYEELHIKVYGS
jgi:hypothetical protein